MSSSRPQPRWLVLLVCVAASVTAGWYLHARSTDAELVALPVTGATLLRHPGVDSGGPDRRTTLDSAEATRLAQLINGTSRMPRAPVNCPADLMSTVTAEFATGGRSAEHAVIALFGCDGPPGRMMSPGLDAELARLAPGGFWQGSLT